MGELSVRNERDLGHERRRDEPPSAHRVTGRPRISSPDWSPDGSLIAYAAGGDIVVMNSDGTDPHTITTDPADDFGPAWSPDSTQIAFVSTRYDPQQHYVIDVDGTDEHKPPTDGRVAVPDWSGAGSGTVGPQAIDLGGAAWSTVYGFGGAWIEVDPPVDQLVKVHAETRTLTMTVDGGTAAAMNRRGVGDRRRPGNPEDRPRDRRGSCSP